EWFAPSRNPPRTGSRDISKWAGRSVVGETSAWSASGSGVTSLCPLGLSFAGLAFDLVEIAPVVARSSAFGAFLRAFGGSRSVGPTLAAPVLAAVLALTFGFSFANFVVGVLVPVLVVRAFTRFVVRTFLARELPAVVFAIPVLARAFVELALLVLDFLA